MTYGGVVRSEKAYARIYWIMEKLHTKNEGPRSRGDKVMSLQSF